MLNSLKIENFRALKSLEVRTLGRVNLIVGKNNSGKSTVLEALRIYAGNARASLLREISASHNEKYDYSKPEKGESIGPMRFEHFFTGRKFPENEDNAIVIGEVNSKKSLQIQHVFFIEKEEEITDSDGDVRVAIRRRRTKRAAIPKNLDGNLIQALVVSGKGKSRATNIYLQRQAGTGFGGVAFAQEDITPCSFVPTQLVSMDQIASDWDKIALSRFEEIAKDALKIIDSDFEDIAFVNKVEKNEDPANQTFSRTAFVKLKNFDHPVPLNSMGEGMVRVLQLILKVFQAKDGILLIDEFENGLHYSVQEKVWALIFDLSNKLDCQVFATTHSWDCIESFTKVAVERRDIDGVLFRVGRSIRKSEHGNIVATVFDEDKLSRLTQADVEVR